jgi:predicted GTPase
LKKVIIMGAAGRDFHNFNVHFKNNKDCKVVAFTAEQVPGIEGRKYPPELAGRQYPRGIPIYPEEDLPKLIKELDVDEVVFAYSDVSYDYLMHRASIALANGADFRLMGPKTTMVKSKKPVISVCAVRTGCGKSQTSRRIAEMLKEAGKKVAVVRHPMPYGDLAKQAVQEFRTYDDLKKNDCTIEEREEYEPYIERGMTVFAGVDYERILRRAEEDADVILWDGGNNDLPFYFPDLHIVVADPHRAGHESKYHPGEANLRMANVVLINKMNTASREDITQLKKNIKELNPLSIVVEADSVITVEKPDLIKRKKVLVIEDGPTLTHGGMAFGAGFVAAEKLGCRPVDPRKYAVGSIKETFEKYPHLEKILPAMGYSETQIKELEKTIGQVDCDAVVIGTPIDLAKLVKINKPHTRVRYELKVKGRPNLEDTIKFLE